MLVVFQFLALRDHLQGPVLALLSDYVATPKSASVPWAGLALALVGLSVRQRIIAVSAAVALDVGFAAERALRGGLLTVGNGPLIVLTAIAVVAGLRWSGPQRVTALRAAGLGALLVIATKLGDTWLQLTAIARPTVLDGYVVLADRALGDPSWVMGRVVDAMGSVGYGVLHWVYIELPVAAMVVAVYQLRRVGTGGEWPRHYLVRTFLVLGLLGPIVYMIFPVVGPLFAFGSGGHGFAAGDYWPTVVPPDSSIVGAMRFDAFTPRNCMPSMHTAWALSVFLHTRRDIDGIDPAPRWLRWGGTLWLVCTVAATLGFGYHYGVDLVAGAVLCLTVEAALRDPVRGWGWVRIRLVSGGLALLTGLLLAYRFLAVEMAHNPVLAGTLIVGALAVLAIGFYATFFRASSPRELSTVQGGS
ncbi:inositol phosphorylceramide synthase [Skermania sp. ID1734]|nr:phosphatase PAP2 family protein [Skermania sp. ID1734]TSD99570.1 inositol phosphorylceramide synthase [Skermania sp. ID1734]